MIQKESFLEVADNSGAKVLKCFHICGSTRKRYARLGDEVICAVKRTIPGGGYVKKGQVVRAVIVRVRKEVRREDGSYIRFGDNAAVLLKDDEGTMVGTRVPGVIARELRAKAKYNKIVSLALEVV